MKPQYEERSFLSLIRSLRSWCLQEQRDAFVGDARHLVFLLIDGLGEVWLQRLGSDSFLAQNQVGSLSAVYPSTTTVALATLATAEPPSRHGMAGWWTYLSEQDLSTTPLLAKQLSKGLCQGSKLIVSADHGLLDIEESAKYILREGEPILECLLTPPSGEPRNPVFHVKDGCMERFRHLFEEQFFESFELIESRKLQALLGGELRPVAKSRFGDFVGAALGPSVIHYRTGQDKRRPAFIGYHGGLTPEEMRIPLISIGPKAK